MLGHRVGCVGSHGLRSKALLNMFTACAQQIGLPAVVPSEDAVLCITVAGLDHEAPHFIFASLAAASGQSGHHVPTQTFADLECIDGNPSVALAGVTLRFRTQAAPAKQVKGAAFQSEILPWRSPTLFSYTTFSCGGSSAPIPASHGMRARSRFRRNAPPVCIRHEPRISWSRAVIGDPRWDDNG